MASAEELRHEFKKMVVARIFGQDWRPETPLDNIGAELQILLQGRLDAEEIKYRAGFVTGLKESLELIDETYRTLNTLNEGRPT